MPKPAESDFRYARNIWAAVLWRAMLDYIAGVDASRILGNGRRLSSNQRTLLERKANECRSIRWWVFSTNNEEINDFLCICDMLRINPADIRAKVDLADSLVNPRSILQGFIATQTAT